MSNPKLDVAMLERYRLNRRALIKNLVLSTVLMSNQQSFAAFSRTDRKREVLHVLKSIQTSDPAPFSAVNPNRYIQPSLEAADGLGGSDALLNQLLAGSVR